jgi:prepilin-type N-terminal cleavage/methylation domain-containing protein
MSPNLQMIKNTIKIIDKLKSNLNSKQIANSEHSDRFVASDRTKGFTLVELLVAVALFAIIVDVAAGGFVRALRAQRQTSALLAANSNASLVLEQMFREMRTGSDFIGENLYDPCPVSSDPTTKICKEITFVNAMGESVTYSYGVDSNEFGVVKRNNLPITGSNVDVKDLGFIILGEKPSSETGCSSASCGLDAYPPRITITLSISPRETSVNENILHLQTTVSARKLD